LVVFIVSFLVTGAFSENHDIVFRQTHRGTQAMLRVIPSLDQLAAEPGRAEGMSTQEARALFARCTVVQAALLPLLLSGIDGADSVPGDSSKDDRLLTPAEAATLMGVKLQWLYRHASQYKFARRLSRKCLRFSEEGLRRWLAAKKV
jgi:predicted DNA-binding transcriptional regulator AlpA